MRFREFMKNYEMLWSSISSWNWLEFTRTLLMAWLIITRWTLCWWNDNLENLHQIIIRWTLYTAPQADDQESAHLIFVISFHKQDFCFILLPPWQLCTCLSGRVSEWVTLLSFWRPGPCHPDCPKHPNHQKHYCWWPISCMSLRNVVSVAT